MTAINLTSLVCNNTVNPIKDMIILRRNGTKLAVFDFVDSETQPLSFSVDDGDALELVVKINSTGILKSMGTRRANVNPSPIPFALGSGNYSLNYT